MERGPWFEHGRPAMASRVLEMATSEGPLIIMGLLMLQRLTGIRKNSSI
jgi:hypothetical protein